VAITSSSKKPSACRNHSIAILSEKTRDAIEAEEFSSSGPSGGSVTTASACIATKAFSPDVQIGGTPDVNRRGHLIKDLEFLAEL